MKGILSVVFVLLIAGLAFSQAKPTPSISTMPKASLAKGDVAPDFILSDQNGKSVKLSKLVKKKPVVLVFYRGFW
jgi:cytochrome oxidase Cu insertion factor (SCO1/SenC/PrrC family)